MNKIHHVQTSPYSYEVNEHLKLDTGFVKDGYFMAMSTPDSKNKKKRKLQVEKDGEVYNYDFNIGYIWYPFPLQLGKGTYTISLLQNVIGNKYLRIAKQTVYANISDNMSCYLYPNQYVDFYSDSPSVLKANELCANADGKEAYDIIKSYITNKFRYNYVKGVLVKAGVLPDIDTCFKKKSGICQDLAAVTVAMLRSQGIPAMFVIGYADRNYHAWVRVNFNGKKYLFDPTAAVTKRGMALNYTAERTY